MSDRTNLPPIPHYLEQRNTVAIASAMLEHPVENLATALLSSPDGFAPLRLSREEFDTSFSSQMAAMRDRTGDPDAFLLTFRSALPVAAAIDSYYQELGKPTPYIGHIQAKEDLSDSYFSDHQFYKDIEDKFAIEQKRLRETLPSNANVCVVEQYVSTGQTIAYASELLVAAEAGNISGIRGAWYVQAYRCPEAEDQAAITKMMRDVGRLSARVH